MKWRQKGDTGGKEARERAERQLECVKAKREESRQIGEDITARLKRNHIAEGLQLIYLGRDS